MLRCAAKQRHLQWLVGSRPHWIFLWTGIGLLRVLAVAVLFPRFYRNELLGWTGAAVWNLLYTFLIRLQSVALVYWFVTALTAILEAALYGVFAIIGWWLFEWITLKREHRKAEKYGVAALVAACLVGIANNIYSLRPTTCFDCFWPQGIPFTFFHDGGFAGGEGFVVQGVIGDALVIILVAAFLLLAWNWLSQKHSVAKVAQ